MSNKKWQVAQTNLSATVQKTFAYITRAQQGKTELLVFKHWNPEAGLQVPKGTVNHNETPADAAMREAIEETGLDKLELVTYLFTDKIHFPFDEANTEVQERHFFQLKVTEETADTWTHCVTGEGDDQNMLFSYFWHPLEHYINLVAGMGDYLELLKEG